MGMYDIVSPNIAKRIITKCPICSSDFDNETEWQTKDFESLLSILNLDNLSSKFEMHCICDKCNNFISVVVHMDYSYYNIYTNNNNSISSFSDVTLTNEFKALNNLPKMESKINLNDLVSSIELKDYISNLDYLYNLSNDVIERLSCDLVDNYYIIQNNGYNKIKNT